MNEGWDMRLKQNWSLLTLGSTLAEQVEVREFSKRFPSVFQVLRFQNSHSVSTSHCGLRKDIAVWVSLSSCAKQKVELIINTCL